MAEKPVNHGRDHNNGSDPIPADWHYVGDTGEPAFQNSWANSGGTYAPMRFRYLPTQDSATGAPGIEIQGSVTGGTSGTAIFTLPVTLDYDLHLATSDDTGSFIVLTVQQSGDVIAGFV